MQSPYQHLQSADEETGALINDNAMTLSTPDASPSKLLRPDNPRSSTDPSPSVLLQGWFKEQQKSDWARPSSSHRNRSPYSRSHLRSRSSGAALLSAPLMTRAHSMPNPHTPRPFEQPTTGTSSSGSLSPNPSQRSPARPRSPLQPVGEEDGSMPALRSPPWLESSTTMGSGIEAIQEDSELDFTPRSQAILPSPLPQHSSNSRSSSARRRPASPLHSLAGASQPLPTSFPASVSDQNASFNTTSSGSSSPALGPQKYNEAYPSLHHYASSSSFSSIPSTPTSARSRSPSISSLETIEDAPEQESEAVELERIERLRLAVERAEQGESDSEGEGSGNGGRRRNGSLDVPRFSRGGVGRERKRWSVCGGERRADLDLETIWED